MRCDLIEFDMQVIYKNGISVNHGDELNAKQVEDLPLELIWPADQNKFYTIILVGEFYTHFGYQNDI